MGHAGTDPEIFERVVQFASEIGMIPIPIHKKQNGYILNSLVPLLTAAQELF
jgi:3-hydroxybutyryl-CoA dehydrogenase